MYAAGELVVYGGEGVCRVEGVGAPSLPGMDKTRLYYTLSPLYRSGQVMTPVDTQVLMRPLLTAEEETVFKRGRNAAVHAIPKNATTAQYHQATALECLLGWLYLRGNTDRVSALFDVMMEED